MEAKLTEILNTLVMHQPVTPSASTARAATHTKSKSEHIPKITKPTPSKKSDNATIRYFQDISKYRIHTSISSETTDEGETSGMVKDDTYNPYSLQQLLSRIQTYKPQHWQPTQNTPTLKNLTPLTLSMQGWACSEHTVSELRCVTCSEKLVICIPTQDQNVDDDDYQILIEAIEERHQKELRTAHSSWCPWRKKKSSELIYQIRLENVIENLKAFKTLYLKNSEFADELVDFKLKLSDEKYEDDLQYVKLWIQKEQTIADDNLIKLALAGWEISRLESGQLMATCAADNRRFLLNIPRHPIDQEQVINLIEEHHDWCRFKKGYRVILETFRVIYQATRFEEHVKSQEDQAEVEKELNVDFQDSEASQLNNYHELEDKTAERLAKLREIYFG